MLEKENFMNEALKEAKKAYKKEEIPVGAVIVKNGKIISKAHNLKETKKRTTSHAEIIAINKANKKLKNWRLNDCEMYVTLEPCPMCAGAILQSRIKHLVYGASDPKGGAVESVIKMLNNTLWNHKVDVTAGVLEEESAELLKNFFRRKR